MPTDEPSAADETATFQAEVISRTPPRDCPITTPQYPPFTPPETYSRLGYEGRFWFGTDELWVSLPNDAVWHSLPKDEHGYTQKIPWWSADYDASKEPQPNLIVTGERLDGKSPPMEASSANNAYSSDMGSAMMMGVNIPTAGCWKITGTYKDAELSFVVWVAE